MEMRSRLMQRDVGQPTDVKGDDDMLEQAESLDSDEVRNDDGDEVVDPPDEWLATDDNESLDDKLAAELPGHGVALGLVSEEDVDRTDPPEHGSSSGQIDRTPEDGDSLFDVPK